MLLVLKDLIIIADYKPSPITRINTLKRKFFHSLPQICMYGILIKKKFNLENVHCVTFNHYKAWIYEPETLLLFLGNLIPNYNSEIKKPWNNYFS